MPVTTQLFGRLGNQMFQVANCIAYAARHGWSYQIPQQTTPENMWPIYFTHLPPMLQPVNEFGYYRDKDNHAYEEIPRREQLCFIGYFQSYKYFIDQWDKVEASFAPAFNFPELNTLSFMGRVSVHIRRGDYVTLQEKHPPVSAAYIKLAMRYFIEEKGFPYFTIFSDDIAWCKENLTPEILFPEYSPGEIVFTYMEQTKNVVKDALFDMKVMSMHEHNIISNSTFSWWGAFMNKNPDKIVVTPATENWFGPELSHLTVQDLLLPGWIQMPAVPPPPTTKILEYTPGIGKSGEIQKNDDKPLPEVEKAGTTSEGTPAQFWCHLEALGDTKCEKPCGVGKCEQ